VVLGVRDVEGAVRPDGDRAAGLGLGARREGEERLAERAAVAAEALLAGAGEGVDLEVGRELADALVLLIDDVDGTRRLVEREGVLT